MPCCSDLTHDASAFNGSCSDLPLTARVGRTSSLRTLDMSGRVKLLADKPYFFAHGLCPCRLPAGTAAEAFHGQTASEISIA
jgi:hypothetical protein